MSDGALGVIQVFDGKGAFKAVLGTEQGDVMKWKTPMGITISGGQRLYVVEMLPNRVQVYDILSEQKMEKKFAP